MTHTNTQSKDPKKHNSTSSAENANYKSLLPTCVIAEITELDVLVSQNMLKCYIKVNYITWYYNNSNASNNEITRINDKKININKKLLRCGGALSR